MSEPVIQLILSFQNRTHDINDSKMRPMWNFNVSCVLILWKNKAAFTFNQKVNWCYIVTFEENVLIFRVGSWFEKWADIWNESRRPTSKAMNSFVGILMDKERYFKLQLMRKFRNKLINIFLIFVTIVLDDLFQPLVKLKR
jgi:hypothetical protein